MPKVTIIVPIYNVASYIEKCARSLLCQTLKDIEIIFIDDATPDDSINKLHKILDQYPERRNQCKILRHQNNKGLPAARNTGLKSACGEYIFHCDGDDFLETTMMEEMYDRATKNNADFVYCDWYLSYQHTERIMKQTSFSEVNETIIGMLTDAIKYNVWNKLVKLSIYRDNKILFPEGHSMGEDLTMIRLASCCSKVIHVKTPLYHYVKTNSEAMTRHIKPQALADIKYNVNETVNFLKMVSEEYTEAIELFKLNVKLPFLISSDKEQYNLWDKWFTESNKYIWKNKRLALRTRWLQQMASWHQWWYVTLYYRVVYEFLYKKIYK